MTAKRPSKPSCIHARFSMVIIHQFEEKRREDGLKYIISLEENRCPKCSGHMKVKDYRERQGWTKYGDKPHYLLRRLQCKECGAIHIELPYFLYPYKRYNAEAIKSVLNGKDSDCAASIRTKKRWLKWYSRIWQPILYLLRSILKKDQDLSLSEEVIREKPKEAGWLKTAVMAIINSGEKVPT